MSIRLHRQRGLSLVELMIAVVLGLVVSAGIVTLFTASNNSDLARAQLERLQEEGRFAITQITNDLAMSGAQYCVGTGGNAYASAAGTYLDRLRAPTVYASNPDALMAALNDVTTSWNAPYPPAPAAPYSLPSFLAMRGYDCSINDCTPVDPSIKQNLNGFGIPGMGVKVDDRVVGASVITVRYVDPAGGLAISTDENAVGSTLIRNADGTVTAKLDPSSYKPAAKDFPLAMLADCSGAQIFAVSGQGSFQLVSTGDNFVQPTISPNMVAPKLFDLGRDLTTVTYFLKVVDNGDGMGHTTGALVRRVNGGDGGASEEIARGIERLDFRYGVQLADGTVRHYSAEQVDNSSAADCPTMPLPIHGNDDHGCLWRSVSFIEVDLLVDGQRPLYSLTPNELAYSYATDGMTTLAPPSASQRKVTPLQQGFPVPMLRREFTAVVALRNFNP
ncbi:prepilin-type N-terminal cleavage/methylation domain-containing protein [Dyella sp. M7H15-1]|uniref:PilW family protein n=1 Tax=Dyella sp. M7H15-1 TaxID=2501295 RepID=UPI001004EF35|nr:PilW family protein [Dyella sp. M7H15-1]QAU23319.1 prepilin-type N-terminal cleavage/methylation domain-containing protein [Dyella sp. M7H15-1]